VGQLRIVAGRLKGRRIRVPEVGSIRPTADRVREALFSILGPSVVGADLLDAYAGTGALGFEALSRGAARVVFVESDPSAALALRATARELGVASECSILEGRMTRLRHAGTLNGVFSLILADPPYGDAEEVASFLGLAVGLLAPNGLLVLEREASAAQLDEPLLRLERHSRYGRSRLDFYRPT
jgi:16S rRNA (guanine966-N2)-methyltransferase